LSFYYINSQYSEMNPVKICILTSTGEISETIHFSKTSREEEDADTYHSDSIIHPDDSIRTIKMKLLHELHKGPNANKMQLRPSYEELYFFGFAREETTTLQLFDALKTDDIQDPLIPRGLIEQMLEGHPEEKMILKKLKRSAKDKIPYSTFESLLSEKKIQLSVKTPIGITFAGGRRDGTFEVDPFAVEKHRAYLIEHSNLHYFDDSLLLNVGLLTNNTIYVCLADRVYDSISEEAEEYIARYYFPGLYKSGVKSKETLITNRGKLVKSTEKLLTEERTQYYKSIDAFYEIAMDRGEAVQYVRQGIQKITLRLKNRVSQRANLETLFKNMHCSREIPYIKFNPGNRRENLYRFYFERTTRTGKKIPYLPRAQIMRMVKETGRGQQISVYLEGAVLNDTNGRILSNCYLHFETDGNVQLQLSFSRPIDEQELDETIRDKILPYMVKIGRDVRPSGFALPIYSGLRDVVDTKIVDMTFVTTASASKLASWETVPCIYSICTLNVEKPGQPPIARLKRIENFKKMEAAQILIAELYGQVQYGEMGLQDIVDELVSRGLSENEESARILIAGFLSTINEMNGDIVERPGFPMEMTVNTSDKTIEISVSELTSIFYLDTVSVYIDAIIKTTQIYKESNPLIKHLRQLCKKSAKFKEAEIAPEDAPVVDLFKQSAMTAFREEGPLRLANLSEDDDFFSQFDFEEEETQENNPTNFQENEEDVENLLEKLRNNTRVISKPIMFEEPEQKSEQNEKQEQTIQTKEGPIVFYDSEEEEEEEFSTRIPSRVATTPLPPPSGIVPVPMVNNEMKDASPVPVNDVNKENEQEPVKGPGPGPGPIMFYDSDEDEYGGAKNVKFVEPSDVLEDAEEEQEDDIEDQQPKQNELLPDGNPLKSLLLKELQKRDPIIFTSTKKNGVYKTFSTSCQPTTRHPVILTKEEFDKTDKTAYENVIKYGSDPKNPHYFICPRFWCLKTNSAISEKDAREGKKCGRIIPKGEEFVPKGTNEYVYELNGDNDDQYPFPGFMENTREDGKCLPCCFKSLKGKKQREARERCAEHMKTGEELESDSEEEQDASNKKKKPKKQKNPIPPKKQSAKTTQYIISLDTFPIPETRWGYLPIPVQLFFQMDYRPSVDPNNPALLQPGKEVLLRYGVERSKNQSFLGCFADIYAHRQGLEVVPSISEFCKILTETVNLDVFAKAHNGSLLSAFYPGVNTTTKRTNNVNGNKTVLKETRNKYKDTEFALALGELDSAKKRHLDDAIIAYENFIAFLSDKESKIDHQYLWDFVCDDNSRITPRGLNLVILEIQANDIIDKIELVCPTNLYSRNQYDSAKDTVVLLKHDEFYEPIYMYGSPSDEGRVPNVIRFFSQNNLPITISEMLKRVEQATKKYCPGMPSLPKIYRFANPITIQRLLGALVKVGAKIESQVVNYQGKTIGLMVLIANNIQEGMGPKKTGAIYVPCAPSARLKMQIKYMDSLDIPKEYEHTTETLNRLSAATKIPCKPVWKIREDGLVVGFLTETNQFVPIQPTQDIIMDGLQTYEGVNHFAADKTVATESKGDKMRIKMTKYITLESQFYHAFRNRIRVLFGEFANRPLKNEIRRISEDKSVLYSQKIQKIEPLIEKLMKGNIVFVDIDKSTLMDLAEVSECDDVDDEGPTCVIKENEVAQLVIPKWNLLSKYDNEMIYVGRVADELIRNDRVKSFMYDTKTRLNSRTTDYQIKDDEFILVQSALTPDYFSEFESSRDSNKYAKTTNYELASPSISLLYPNEKIPISEQYQPVTTRPLSASKSRSVSDSMTESKKDTANDCLVRTTKIVGNRLQVWDRIFSKDAREHVFRDTVACTYQPLIYSAKSKLRENWTVADVKNKLIAAYLNLFEIDPANMLKIAKIMREQGKAKMFEKYAKPKAKIILSPEEFQDIVMDDGYYLCDMDIWVVANEYNLPIVVFNANGLKGFFSKLENDETTSSSVDLNKQWIKMGGDKVDSYQFIRSKIRVAKSSYANRVYEYNVIVPAVKLAQTGEFEEMVVNSVKYDQLNTLPLVDALVRFF
jgi:hypothetical protein